MDDCFRESVSTEGTGRREARGGWRRIEELSLLAAAFIVVWWPILFGGQTIARSPLASTVHPDVIAEQVGWPVNDSLASAQQDEVWLDFIGRSLRRGEWPLVNPHNGLGAPLLESLQPGVLYPLNLLLPLLPVGSPWLFDLFSLIHVAIFLAGLRSLYARFAPSRVATAIAILVGLSGLTWQNVNMVHYRGLVWFPWLLLALIAATESSDWRSRFGKMAAALSVGVCIVTAGNLQDAAVSLATAGVCSVLYALTLLADRDHVPAGTSKPWRAALVPPVLIVAVVFVTAGTWFPYLRGVAMGDLATVADPSRCLETVPARWMLSWLLPNIHGLFPTQLLERQFWFLPQPQLPTSIAFLVLLAVLVSRQGWSRGERWWLFGLLGLCGVMLLKTVGTPLFDWLRAVPFLNGIKYHKYNGVAVVLFGLIAASGLGRLATVDDQRRRVLVTRTVVALAIVVGLILLWLNVDRSWSLKHALNRSAALFVVRSIVVTLGTTVLTGLVLVGKRNLWGPRLAILWTCQAVWLLPPGWLPRIEAYQSPWTEGRLDDTAPRSNLSLSPIAPNSGLLWGESQPGVFDPVLNRRFKAFFNRFFTARYPDFALYQQAAPTRRQLAALALLGVDSVAGFSPPPDAPITRHSPWSWTPQDALPAAFWLSKSDCDDFERRWRELAEDNEPALERFIRDLQTAARRHPAIASQTATGTGRIDLTGPRSAPGSIIWLRAYHSGWRRTEGGVSHESILPFLDTFLAIPDVDPAGSTVLLTAVPASWLRIGICGVVVGLVFAIGSVFVINCSLKPATGPDNLPPSHIPQPDALPGSVISSGAALDCPAVSEADRRGWGVWIGGVVAAATLAGVVGLTCPGWELKPIAPDDLRSRAGENPDGRYSAVIDVVADVPTTGEPVVNLPVGPGRPPIVVRGLAGDGAHKQSASRVWLEIGDRLVRAVVGVVRLDRVEPFAAPEFGRAGWVASVPLDDWPESPVPLVVWCEFGDRVVRIPTTIRIAGVPQRPSIRVKTP